MAVREDLVTSAAKFLQDPSVASSPPESRVAFLKAKNLTPEEISVALARAGLEGNTPGYGGSSSSSSAQQRPLQPGQPPAPYFGSPYAQQPYPPPYGWQPQPHEMPRRDWRDWFIMATVVGGVGYGLYSMTKRYIYPLVAPPTPDRLEEDKKAIDAQFERAFALVEQLAKDTDELKAAEKERTERLDAALANLETVVSDLKTSSKRREDDAERLRDDVKTLKEALPRSLEAQREVTDSRLRDVNSELKGLKTLIGQRMAPTATTAAATTTTAPTTPPASMATPAATVPATPNGNSYLRPSSGNAVPAASAAAAASPAISSADSENVNAAGKAAADKAAAPSTPSTSNGFIGGYSASNLAASTTPAASPAPTTTTIGSSLSTFGTTGKPSIPAWQRAMATSSKSKAAGSGSGTSTPQPEASGSA